METKIKNAMKWFLESYYFTGLISLITIICFKVDNGYIPIITTFMFTTLFVIFKSKFNNMLILIFSMLAGFRGDTLNPGNPLMLVAIAFMGIFLISVIIDIDFHYRDFARIVKEKIINNKLLYALLAFFVPMLLSMINAKEIGYSFFAMGEWLIFIIIYFFALFKLDINEETFKHLATQFLFISIIIAIEMSIVYREIYNKNDLFECVVLKKLILGWSISNHYVMIIIFSLIMTLYLFVKANKLKFLYVIFVLMQLVLIVLCMSRAGFLGTICILPPLFVVMMHNSKSKKIDLIYIFSGIIIFSIICLLMYFSNKQVEDFVKKIINQDFDRISDRKAVYDVAILNFKNHWLIGNGFKSSHYYLINAGHDLMYYHNYLLQVLSDLGIFGLGFFITLLYFICRNLFDKNIVHSFIFIVIFYMLIHGMFDTAFFNKRLMMLLMIILPFTSKKCNLIALNEIETSDNI